MEENKIKVYIRVDENKRVTAINSSVFISDTTEWIEIDDGNGDKYAHAQGSYLDKPLIDTDGTHNYVYEDSIREAVEREKEVERASFPSVSPGFEYKISDLEEQMALADETAIELYELQSAQEKINDAQDDALIEIYEMLGGQE